MTTPKTADGMSEGTPRVDDAEASYTSFCANILDRPIGRYEDYPPDGWETARQLERELSAAQSENLTLQGQIFLGDKQLSEARAECERLKPLADGYHKANGWNDTSQNLEDWLRNLVPEITLCQHSERSVIEQVVDLRERAQTAESAAAAKDAFIESHFELCECRGEDQFTCARCTALAASPAPKAEQPAVSREERETIL